MGLIDRIVLAVSPKAAIQRAYYREMYRDFYSAAESGRKKEGWTSVNSTGEETDRGARDIIRARARDLERNDDMFKGVILDLERNVIGNGIMLQVKSRDENDEERDETNTAIERAWRNWCKPASCTVTGTMSFTELQNMVVRRRYVDGGILVLKTYDQRGLRLQLVEVDELDGSVQRHDNNRVVGGIEIDEYNRPIAYHIRLQNINGFYAGKSERIEADRVIYLTSRTRPSQIREFSPSASSLSRVDDVHLLTEAALKKEQVQACFGVAIVSEGVGGSGLGRGIRSSNCAPGGDVPYPEEYLAPGIIKHLQPGESIESISPAGMSSTADAMIRTIQRQLGAGAGLSYEAVSRDMSQVNYSSARQGMIQDRKTYTTWQQYLIDHLLDPVYQEWLEWSVMTGQIDLPDYFDDPDKYAEVVWIPSGTDWIDPQKEANANKIALETNQTTLQNICASRGYDWRDLIKQRARERELMAQMLPAPEIQNEEEIVIYEDDKNEDE